jgi:MFS family permease
VNARGVPICEVDRVGPYLRLLRNRRYRLLWAGDTLSGLGDGAAWVALAWTILELEGSAAAVGLLLVAYTAPVVVGGPLAGVVLDRFDRRGLLIADNLVRGTAMAGVPLLYALDLLRTWQLFVAAALYGLLKMLPLAGVPSILPDIVADDELDTANAMESLSYWLGTIAGPAVGGALLALTAGPYVLALDAVTYFAFALALIRVGPVPRREPDVEAGGRGLRPAFRFVLGTPIVLATTVMFMLVNVGEGLVIVLLPLYVDDVAGATAYGALVGAGAIGGLAGALFAGAVGGRLPYGRSIAVFELLAGLALVPFAFEPPLAAAFAAVTLSSFFLGPLTVWAQTVRMRLIPAGLRGRVFGTLRTAMQGTLPLGGAFAPALVAAGGVRVAFVGAVVIVAVPGLVGLFLPALRYDGRATTPADV